MSTPMREGVRCSACKCGWDEGTYDLDCGCPCHTDPTKRPPVEPMPATPQWDHPAMRAVEAALDAALSEVRRQGGADYLLREARTDGINEGARRLGRPIHTIDGPAPVLRAEIDGPGGWKELCKGHESALSAERARAEDARAMVEALRLSVQARVDERDAERAARTRVEEALPDDLRAQGWAVAVHNDYRLAGVPHTFWLLTKGDRCVKGEGRTDADALNVIRRTLGDHHASL